MRSSDDAREITCHRENRTTFTRANIEHVSDAFGGFQREETGPRDIVHMDEITPLMAVLEHKRRPLVQQAGSKNCEHAGIGI